MPLNSEVTYERTKPFAHAVAQALERAEPEARRLADGQEAPQGQGARRLEPERPAQDDGGRVLAARQGAAHRSRPPSSGTRSRARSSARTRRRSASRRTRCSRGSRSAATCSRRCSSSRQALPAERIARAAGEPPAAGWRLPRRVGAPASCTARSRAISGSLSASARISSNASASASRPSRGLRLGGLDHQRLVDQEREVDRRRVKAEVEQALGHVQRLHAELALRRRPGEDELVHAEAVEGERQVPARPPLPQPREQVVGVQDGRLRGLGEPVAAEAPDVGVGADEDAEVAREPAQPADRLRSLVVEVEPLAPRRWRPRTARPAAPAGTARSGPRPRSARPRARRRRAAGRTTCGG